MKFRILFITALVLLSSCKDAAPRTDYLIEGNAKGLYNGIRIFLNEVNEQGRMVSVDTAIVINEKFQFQGKVDTPKLYFLTTQTIPGRLPIMVENALMTFDLDNKIIQNSILKGSESHNEMQEYNNTLADFKETIKTLGQNYSDAKFLNNPEKAEQIQAEIEKVNADLAEYPYQFLDAHKDSYVSFQVLEPQLRLRNLDFDKLSNAYENLNPELKASEQGKAFEQKFNDLKIRVAKTKATEIGAKAPEFSGPSPSGETIALSDVYKKGKVTIIDFWAAWCGPCRRENPNLVAVYEKYHDKGLEIIGVSLDGRRGQQNPKEAWMKAIEDDKLNWHQISNLQYFGPIASTYNVGAIPAMFVVDNEGTIVAKNLRGPRLEQKIAELLGE